ncbi:unnamed protein product [Cylindrotheca closterium]|uniref:DUF6824 domain-containing protein n=1 Tax=Cylindrotheca closterium TaxID=2856 RepID=A0AAD2CUR7_9STRA|nr:unnamed protein product [Cylindrotheca closterium]
MNVTQVARYTKGPQETAEETAMIFINDKHILLGRGKGPNGHPGNIRMRRIVDKYRTQYHEVERTEKRLVVRKVHDEVISGGTKFLKRSETEDGWEEVTVNIALEKVGHSLRCFKRRSKGRGVNRSNPVTSRNESSVPSEITATLNATSPPRMRSSQGVGQDRMPGLQYVPGMTSTMTSTPTEAGLFPSVPLLRNGSVRFGVSSLLPNQSSSLDAYLRGMERNRLLSELVVARTVHLPALSGTLSDAFSSRQLYGVMEQEQQIRQLLLRQHFMASQNRELPPWYSG